MRPSSRASRSTHHSTTPRPESPTKDRRSPSRESNPSRSLSNERRVMGPRSPSPLLPRSPSPFHSAVELPSMDVDLALEALSTHSSVPPPLHAPPPSAIPRSKRQPFYPTGNTEATPKPIHLSSSVTATPIEPLSIKKKTSVRSSATMMGSPTPSRKSHVRNSPLSRTLNRVVSPKRVSPGFKRMKASTTTFSNSGNDDFEHIRYLSVSTKEDVSICHSYRR